MLKLQYFGHLMRRTDSLEKTLKLGKIEGKREQQRRRWLDGSIHTVDMNLAKSGDIRGQESLVYCNPRGCTEPDSTLRLYSNG